ncbi:glutathione S-transferase F13 [Colletotrichum spaethianum]|uniref:Glutathione S-transferase F13 n=1 Tax=Colletotrichum spaethianum TaxID=700344 RepID=A0AA37PFY6_9PEZI|nr:glutathione S-transferase F13 [Colletotrichum spaethianum]GKT51447.1 glutathione S-transferase F13 [Colletotrichum spaethianum]
MASSIKFYGDFVSPYTVICLFALHEKDLLFDFVDVKLLSPETDMPKGVSSGYAVIIRSSQEQTETLYVLTKWITIESRAISRWLAVKYANKGTPLLPRLDDPEAVIRFEEAACFESPYLATPTGTYTREKRVKP